MREKAILEDYLSNPKEKTVEHIAGRIFFAAGYLSNFVILDILDYDEDEINSVSTIFSEGEKEFFSKRKSIFQLYYSGTGESGKDVPPGVIVRVYNPSSDVTRGALDIVKREFDRK